MQNLVATAQVSSSSACCSNKINYQIILSRGLSSIATAYGFTKSSFGGLNKLFNTFLALPAPATSPPASPSPSALQLRTPVLSKPLLQPMSAPTFRSILAPIATRRNDRRGGKADLKSTAQYQADEKKAWGLVKRDAYKPAAVP